MCSLPPSSFTSTVGPYGPTIGCTFTPRTVKGATSSLAFEGNDLNNIFPADGALETFRQRWHTKQKPEANELVTAQVGAELISSLRTPIYCFFPLIPVASNVPPSVAAAADTFAQHFHFSRYQGHLRNRRTSRLTCTEGRWRPTGQPRSGPIQRRLVPNRPMTTFRFPQGHPSRPAAKVVDRLTSRQRLMKNRHNKRPGWEDGCAHGL